MAKTIPKNEILRYLSGLKPRQFGLKGAAGRQALREAEKAALQAMMAYWHREIVPIHFTAEGYSRYSLVYYRLYAAWRRAAQREARARLKDPPSQPPMELKPKRFPLIASGNLRQNVLGRIAISGSANRVVGRMYFGRPQARKKFGANDPRQWRVGYSETAKETFRAMLSAFNSAEIEELVKFIEHAITETLRVENTTLTMELL